MTVRLLVFVTLLGWSALVFAQQSAPGAGGAAAAPETAADMMPVTGLAPGGNLPEYRIGPGDVLGVLFWRDRELTTDVVVRPDGRISLPVMNEMEVVGLSTEELRARITERARKYVADPIVSVVVRQIHSRYVFITGKVNKPGPYQLYGPMSVLQLIAMAAGLQEYADKSAIVIVRDENGKQQRLPFNFDDVVKRGILTHNIMLRPGDTVVVP
jgi:polysaccharide export outer membrane protein